MTYFSIVQYEKILFDCTINLIHYAIYSQGIGKPAIIFIAELIKTRNICKEIYRTEDIFDMSNVRIFNEEIAKKKWGMFIQCTLLCLRSTELRKALGLRNLCYSKISVVMLPGYA